ncbi:hypothetical protein T439DRAFT_322123 [Meredithblackwellia eburnea MCA 4105]
MAKGSNPADAHRKALKKKELAKNKAARTKAREISTVKRDTRGIENEIRQLEKQGQKGPLGKDNREKLNDLKQELEKVNKAKNDYVTAHPEHRHLVFPSRQTEGGSEASTSNAEPPGLYNRDGKLKDPTRSFYYDPVFNPFGAPPPGMPYRERAPTAEELAAFQPVVSDHSDSDEDEEDEQDDEDIKLPAGPPPDVKGSDDDSDDSGDDSDDIPMPDGPPPPPKTGNGAQPLIARPQRGGPPSHHQRTNHHPYPRPPTGPRHPQPFHPNPSMRHALPPRPPTTLIDPLQEQPVQPFQARHVGPSLPPQTSVSQPPVSASQTSAGPVQSAGPFLSVGTGSHSGATISSAPVLRDLKKEATAFVPSNIRRKQAAAAASKVPMVNAAPGTGNSGSSSTLSEKKDLMGMMREKGIAGTDASTKEVKRDGGKEDYERFQREMADFL